MLLAMVACVLGIVIESVKWPLDRREQKERFAESSGFAESTICLAGLVLAHPVVRWLMALAAAGVVVSSVLRSPGIMEAVREAKEANRLAIWQLDLLSGLAVSVVMCVIALAARRLAK
jgi:hypothetical protein